VHDERIVDIFFHETNKTLTQLSINFQIQAGKPMLLRSRTKLDIIKDSQQSIKAANPKLSLEKQDEHG